MRLKRSFFQKDAYSLAQDLLGKLISIKINNQIKKFRIVETESYGGATDKACHAYEYRKTNRTAPLYLDGGHVYIYLIYGMYYMFNITASYSGDPQAVLIRAVEPLELLEGKSLTNGPGKLCKNLGIGKTFNEIDLVKSEKIYIEDVRDNNFEVVFSKRINIDYAEEDKEHLWRFYIKDNLHVSKK